MTGHVQPQKRSTTILSACIFNPWKSIFVKTMRVLSRNQRTESVENMQWGAQRTNKTSSQKTFMA